MTKQQLINLVLQRMSESTPARRRWLIAEIRVLASVGTFQDVCGGLRLWLN